MSLLFNSSLVLEDLRVRLEPLTWLHFEPLLPICLKYPDLLKYSAAKFGDEPSLRVYFQEAFEQQERRYRYPFAIYDKAHNAYAGTTSFTDVSEYDSRIKIGYTWISADYHRSGLNRHCKFLMLAHAFEHMGMLRVAFRADNRNLASRRALEALGASFEGEFRNDTLMPDGYRRSTVYYSILWEEWIEIKTARFARQIISTPGSRLDQQAGLTS
ncbi:MAG: GNAT family N-acetyltransferase [Roseivirga sp.]|nr:GNAT family N-acetyltransferase [Roseivirga sp.]